jgi:hypothetical protein
MIIDILNYCIFEPRYFYGPGITFIIIIFKSFLIYEGSVNLSRCPPLAA